jgi:multidrug efflux pump
MIDRATALRHGAIQAVQKSLYSMEAWAAAGQKPTPLSERFATHRIGRALEERLSTAGLQQLFVQSSTTNSLVPLSLLVRVRQGLSPITIDHQGLFPVITLSFNLAPGTSLGEAVSAIHPLTIISTLPSAGIGALLALRIAGQDLWIMGMIGILLLIGIVKKNAILMIDFALVAERDQANRPTMPSAKPAS